MSIIADFACAMGEHEWIRVELPRLRPEHGLRCKWCGKNPLEKAELAIGRYMESEL